MGGVVAKNYNHHIIACLGTGKFGVVNAYLAKDQSSLIAVKTYSVERAAIHETKINREIDAMRKLNGQPYIVTFFETDRDCNGLYLLMECCIGGSLNRHIKSTIPNGFFDVVLATLYLAELISALKHMCIHGIVHRDIKANNIMLDKCGHIRIIDFGSSTCLYAPTTLAVLNDISYENLAKAFTVIGSEHSMAPEMRSLRDALSEAGYSVHADWFAMGVLFYEMLTGISFDEDTVFAFDRAVAHAALPLTSSSSSSDYSTVASAAIGLLEGLLLPNPMHRLGGHSKVQEVLAHSLFVAVKDIGVAVDWDQIDAGTSPPPNVHFNKLVGNFDLLDMFVTSSSNDMQAHSTIISTTADRELTSAEQDLFAGF